MAFISTSKSIKRLYFVASFLTFFNGLSQGKLITLHLNNEPISSIVKSIENQTNYKFIYNSKNIDANQKLTINVDKASLENILIIFLKEKQIAFYIKNKQVLLTKNKPETATSAGKPDTEKIIKGVVLDAKSKKPIQGAVIKIKGNKYIVVTDSDGKFMFLVNDLKIDRLVLEVSSMGMKTQTTLISNQSEFIFYLEESVEELDQLVITSSYGTKKMKEEIVGSISTIKAKDIPIHQTSESIDKMLEGQIAGVLIENTSGIGGPVNINIRGQGTIKPLNNSLIGTSTQPLIIIDGVIMSEQRAIDNNFFDGGRFSQGLSNPLAMIAPENIETITVLKDAAAVGLYGADGANGVILITTKKGKLGKVKYTFSSQIGTSRAINQIKYLNGEQYTELRNNYLKNTSANYVPLAYNGINTDWFDLLNNAGIFNKSNFSLSGATSNFSYRTSLSYMNIDEPQLGNGTKQLNAGINIGYKQSKWSVNLALNPSYIKKNAPNTFYNFAYLPTLSPFNTDGSYSNVGVFGTGSEANPLAAIAQNKNEDQTIGVLGSLSLDYVLNRSIKFNSLFGLNYVEKEQDRWFSGENESGQGSGTFVLNGITYPTWGRRLINNRQTNRWNWQGQAIFNKEINKNNGIDGVIGFEISDEKETLNYNSAQGFVNPNLIQNVSESLQDDNPKTTLDESTNKQIREREINNSSRISAFAQMNYNYKKRYFALFNIRRDQSSVFGDDSNVAINSGAGLAWIVSNENFLKSNSWIDLLKFKLSYGSTGNSRIGSYRSKGLFSISQTGYNGAINANTSTGPNGALSWEKNLKFNLGVEWNIFKTIEFLFEFYNDDKRDMITSRNIPVENGYSSLQLNASSMYNRGYELTTRIKFFRSKKFKWTTTFNVSTVNNKVTDLLGLGSTYSNSNLALAQKVGYSTTTIWGVKWAGIDPATGRDLVRKDGQVYDAVTYRRLFTQVDLEPIGDTQPKAFGGFSNTFSFNDKINLTIVGAFQWGGDALITDEIISKYNTLSNRNMSVNAYDYWRNQGDIVSQPTPSNNTLIQNMSKYIYDASFIKINNINLSYKLPIIKRFVDNLTVFADVSNVFYWYRVESPKGMNGIREFNFNYPQARTFSCGINANF